MTTQVLDLKQSNCTLNLYNNYPQIEFYSVNVTQLFRGLPIEGVEQFHDPKSPIGPVKMSELVRKALIFKFGGFYSDLDVVVLKSLRSLSNFYPLQSDRPM